MILPKPVPKAEQLRQWAQSRGVFSYHDVQVWAMDHYYNRAERTIRDFQERGWVRKLTPAEKTQRDIQHGAAVFTWVGEYAAIEQGQYCLV
jgi:hypothetical protein